SMLFGLKYEKKKSEINNEQTLSSAVKNCQNEEIMNKLFNYHLKKYIAMSIECKSFFINWKNQESNIIKLNTKLKEIYPPDYIFNDCELYAWRTLLKHTGCDNITPFGKGSMIINKKCYSDAEN
ncbi:2343_t:CDS:1, partial [Dentiscutata heterogama]